MTAPDRTPTGALFAFMNIYLKNIQDYSPDKVCVCFDVNAPTFRHKQYSDYKATRKGMPEDLAVQMPIVKEILDAMGVTRLEMEGYEADDLIGSLSAEAEKKGWNTYILSGDKDDLQLVSDKTTLLMPFSKGGQTTTEVYDRSAVISKYSVAPDKFVDLKAIMGDPSDNIPGVRGIGEKGATELISKYGSLEVVYESLSEIRTSLASKLLDNKDMAFLSRELSEIKRDIEVGYVFDDMERSEANRAEMLNLFKRLGFRYFINKFDLKEEEIINDQSNEVMDNYISKDISKTSINEFAALFDASKTYMFPRIANVEKIITSACSDTEYLTDEYKALFNFEFTKYVCIYSAEHDKLMIDIGDDKLYIITTAEFGLFAERMRRDGVVIAGYKIKELLGKLKSDVKDTRFFDISVAAHLLNISDNDLAYEIIAERSVGPDMYCPPSGTQVATMTQTSFFDDSGTLNESDEQFAVSSEKLKYDLCIMNKIVQKQFEMLAERDLTALTLYIEMPLIRILYEMEKTGISINSKVLNDLSVDFTRRIKETELKIFDLAGEEFNINSPKQLGEVLFEKLKLPSGKKGKTGYSTNAEVLDSLIDRHSIVREIISYRELSKLKSTFLEGLARSIDHTDGRVHTTFHQTLTSTGRLSSSNPNIQNIPIKSETGREIRRAFVAEEGSMLIDADYSQIELRLLADFSGDQQMREAFTEYDDIHLRTAEELFDLPRDMITSSMRSIAKTINFSIVYGIGDFSLAKDLGITMSQAHQYIDEYHRKYPGIKPYLQSLLDRAYKVGYVETAFKRRRYIDELKSQNRNVRLFGERAAMNAPVQGSAADIIKIAMVILDRRLRNELPDGKLVLQVHDELILEVRNDKSQLAAKILKESMENAVKLSVPLIAEVEVKKDWF